MVAKQWYDLDRSTYFYLKKIREHRTGTVFSHSFDFDEDGLLFYIGSNAKTCDWVNPAQYGLVQVTSSEECIRRDWYKRWWPFCRSTIGKTIRLAASETKCKNNEFPYSRNVYSRITLNLQRISQGLKVLQVFWFRSLCRFWKAQRSYQCTCTTLRALATVCKFCRSDFASDWSVQNAKAPCSTVRDEL